jgi:hypothetical protein
MMMMMMMMMMFLGNCSVLETSHTPILLTSYELTFFYYVSENHLKGRPFQVSKAVKKNNITSFLGALLDFIDQTLVCCGQRR